MCQEKSLLFNITHRKSQLVRNFYCANYSGLVFLTFIDKTSKPVSMSINVRFIVLVDCGHTFEANLVKKLMNKPFVEGEILPKSCPLCRTEIRTSFRFKSVLMRTRKDMNGIKEKIYGNPQLIYKLLLEVHQVLKSDLRIDSVQWNVRSKLRRALYSSKFLEGTTGISFRQMTLMEAQSLAFVAKTYSRCISLQEHVPRSDLPSKFAQAIKQYKIRVLDFLLTVPWPLTGFEIRSVSQEWNRISDLRGLSSKHASNQHEISKRLLQQPRGKAAFQKAYNIVCAIGIPYDDHARSRFIDALKNLEQALKCKIGISDAERLDILKAFNFTTGRWFKCPNGHIYVITECGGATEESVCNECGAKVGGENHRVLPTNELASEMDGATKPLYPTALDRQH